jgi:hypothetical protein
MTLIKIEIVQVLPDGEQKYVVREHYHDEWETEESYVIPGGVFSKDITKYKKVTKTDDRTVDVVLYYEPNYPKTVEVVNNRYSSYLQPYYERNFTLEEAQVKFLDLINKELDAKKIRDFKQKVITTYSFI